MQFSRLLVTTADERTWNTEAPTLFLGEWCRLYSRRELWTKMNAIILDSKDKNFHEKQIKREYLERLYLKILTELTSSLNNYHRVNLPERYWSILLGHWVKRCIDSIFERYSSIDYALKNYKINESILLECNNYNIATKDSASFTEACNDNLWNNIFYGIILKYMGFKNIKVLKIKNYISSDLPKPHKINYKNIIKKLIQKFLSLAVKENDAVIIGSYLPFWVEIKLQLSLWQCPQIWINKRPSSVIVENSSRERFTLGKQDLNGFDFFIRDMIPKLMPTCYLEGYKKLTLDVKKLSLPKSPKFIFTSNNFDYDDIFKAWVADKVVCQGVPYFTGQHGNNYGTHLDFGTELVPERITSDGFFAWGTWGNGVQNVIPSFMFKMEKKNIKHNSTGALLLVEKGVPLRIYANDLYSLHERYQESQFLFIESLPPDVSSRVEVRLFTDAASEAWSDVDRWKDRSPQTKLIADELGGITIFELFARSRIAVFSYDSTGILEALFLDMPMICFWSEGLDYLLPDAKPYYQLLIDANILFTDPVSAAKHIALHWEDIDKWWNSEFVQEVKKVFCAHYAAFEKKPALRIKNLLLERADNVLNKAN